MMIDILCVKRIRGANSYEFLTDRLLRRWRAFWGSFPAVVHTLVEKRGSVRERYLFEVRG